MFNVVYLNVDQFTAWRSRQWHGTLRLPQRCSIYSKKFIVDSIFYEGVVF